MTEMISELKHVSDCADLNTILQDYFSGFSLEMLLSQHQNDSTTPHHKRYNDTMKEFSVTLFFYSPKAYNFVREKIHLPSERTVRRWLSSYDCKPGILSEVFSYLKTEVQKNHSLKNCALIFDSMSIRKQIIWCNKQGKFAGYTDFGGILDINSENAASEALVFQIVSYRGRFKCPIAYFFTDKLSANLQSKIILACLQSLFDVGITVRSLTCDGAAVNIQTLRHLGCEFNENGIKSCFKHPSCDSDVYFMLDSCHMLKLARNVLADKQMKTPTGEISWKYLVDLNSIQENEGFTLANSVSSKHIYYKNKIMNVKLAAQVLSASVANAIEYLKFVGVPDFQDCGETVKFIKYIDKIFDILNCRNPFGKDWKSPIKRDDISKLKLFLDEIENYFKLINIDGISLMNHPRKTFALGFIVTLRSTINLALDLFSLVPNDFSYLLTYKCSQDHLELTFSCIRSRGGWNNNPNALQFTWALRQLLFRNQITPSINSNTLDFGSVCTPIFEFRSENRQMCSVENSVNEPNWEKLFQLIHSHTLADFQENVMYYIAGFIVRKLLKTLSCIHCKEILLYKVESSLDHSYCATESFTNFCHFSSRGCLIFSSNIVFLIVKHCEKIFQMYLSTECSTNVNLKKLITNSVVSNFTSKIELFIPQHPVSEEFLVEDLHEIQLIKGIVSTYLNCRMHAYGKRLTLALQGNKANIRHKLTKLILFQNL